MLTRRPIEIADPSLPVEPMLSVLMITYNQESFIAEAIESALMQRTDFPFEIVIGEDCSTDTTRRIVRQYQKRFPDRIRLVLQPRNLGWRRNSVSTLRACRGKYTALLEGDDYWTDPDKLQLQVDLLETNPLAFLCGARAHIVPEGSRDPRETVPAGPVEVLSTYGARGLFEGKWWFRTCTKVFPRRLLQRAPDRLLGADWGGTMWCIAHTNFGPVVFVDRVVGVYREHAGGAWTSLPRYQRLLSDIRALYDLIPLFQGEDRSTLRRLLQSYAEEVFASPDAHWHERVSCAFRTITRNPGTTRSWRFVARTLPWGK